jgi:hypothetical protein
MLWHRECRLQSHLMGERKAGTDGGLRKYVTKIVAFPVCAYRPPGATRAWPVKTNNDVIITFCY